MKISIAMPVYECFGRGVEFINYQINKFNIQTFKDFEIIISDNSRDNVIEEFIKNLQTDLDIKYFKNNNIIKNSSSNTNNCIKNCNGEYIKFLFQDDFLFNEYSLGIIADSLEENTQWLVTSCEHTSNDGNTFHRRLDPYYNQEMHLGKNTISGPSVLTIKNNKDKNIFFDERFISYMDVDYYKMLYDKYGEPKIVNEITVVNRLWSHQLNVVTPIEISNNEYNLICQKYGK